MRADVWGNVEGVRRLAPRRRAPVRNHYGPWHTFGTVRNSSCAAHEMNARFSRREFVRPAQRLGNLKCRLQSRRSGLATPTRCPDKRNTFARSGADFVTGAARSQSQAQMVRQAQRFSDAGMRLQIPIGRRSAFHKLGRTRTHTLCGSNGRGFAKPRLMECFGNLMRTLPRRFRSMRCAFTRSGTDFVTNPAVHKGHLLTRPASSNHFSATRISAANAPERTWTPEEVEDLLKMKNGLSTVQGSFHRGATLKLPSAKAQSRKSHDAQHHLCGPLILSPAALLWH